jgi:asparagine synthase (glutamine-hydrolysing)
MSGFVVAYGNPERRQVEAMFDKIHYRGRDASGIVEMPAIVMAQNYLRADGLAENQEDIPVRGTRDPDTRICYDGQMGNAAELARANGVPDGDLREERLLLELNHRNDASIWEHLGDAIFSFVISDGKDLLAARDLLGIKTMFYGRENGSLYLASELKAIMEVTDEVHEFPPGHFMDGQGRFHPFAELPKAQPPLTSDGVETAADKIRRMIQDSVRSRVDFGLRIGSLLSGGIDSSVIAFLASRLYKERYGDKARLKTFALGMGESEDIESARVMAQALGSEHHELIVSLDEALASLPGVIYHLESFDPSLVRSSVSNYLISRYASQNGVELLLSGEGGDEVFCGYTYLKEHPEEELFMRQMECIGFLHNNASLRLDRMTQCNSVKVVAPLISGKLLAYAMTLPPAMKQRPTEGQKIEKWIFRKAYERFLPRSIVWRLKKEFSQGSGSAALLPGYFDDIISDDELEEAQAEYPLVRSKEELHYFRIFKDHFGSDAAIKTVGQWIRL